ncbi:hypothetical protein MUP77_22550 [Candidatus Bathyarchaeota archaeon]|nr:hypothetical protein [Candidatus Bathyarchaeota archaeon]
MSDTVVEHVMLLPLMMIALVLFPVAANSVVINYVNQQHLVIAQSAMNQIVSTVQQLSYSLSQENIMPCNVTMTKLLPQKIDAYTYDVSATTNPSNELTLSLYMSSLNIHVDKTITLSPTTLWSNSQFHSILPTAAIKVEKMMNGTLLFSFV